MQKKSYKIDKKQAILVLKILNNFFDKNQVIDASITVPNNIKLNSPEHYRFLFYSCLVNLGTKSQILHKNLVNLFAEMPEFFDAEQVCKKYNDLEKIRLILKDKLHVRYPKISANNWLNLSKVIYESYNNNPKNMFIGLKSYCEYENKIFKIKGFGQKTGGLLLRALIEQDLAEINDTIKSIPIDIHDSRISINTKVISNISLEELRNNKTAINDLSKVWVEAAEELNISPTVADQYLWLLGNKYCAKNNCENCPLKQNCEK